MRPTLVAFTVLLALGAAAEPPKMTADELVKKNIEARGGTAKLRAITSIHTVGKVRVGGGSEAKTESWGVAPDKYRSEFSLQGMTAVQAWDGQQAWSISPFGGRKDPQKLSADDGKALVEAADLTGPLFDWQAKGSKLESLGTEDIDGTDAYKLRLTQKNGDSVVVFLDPDSFLEIRTVNHRMVRGQEQVQTTDLGEYEQVSGVYFPFEVGRNQIDKVEINVPVDRPFAFPTAVKP
ncbi:MAG TPA: hypothetical protein VFV19_01570 [Candidatus Polarisedimenticolaceae bacterium]|nr:hypothetical protein [Candidatus Polarisedimenticolaceae bacterium]